MLSQWGWTASSTRGRSEWSAHGAHLQTLEGHTKAVNVLALGLDGKVYLWAMDLTIRVWSGDDGTHLQTVAHPHVAHVIALAVGLDGNVDTAILVWSGVDSTHLQSLKGHAVCIFALAVGLDGKVYAGASDMTIQVSSADDGTHLQTLHGHTHWVNALAVGLDGKIYSGSRCDFQVRSSVDGALLHTFTNHMLGVDPDIIGSIDGRGGSMYSCSEYENHLLMR